MYLPQLQQNSHGVGDMIGLWPSRNFSKIPTSSVSIRMFATRPVQDVPLADRACATFSILLASTSTTIARLLPENARYIRCEDRALQTATFMPTDGPDQSQAMPFLPGGV